VQKSNLNKAHFTFSKPLSSDFKIPLFTVRREKGNKIEYKRKINPLALNLAQRTFAVVCGIAHLFITAK
jgi:hypothetical protein